MIELIDLEQLIHATLLLHDSLCSTTPARDYDWSEVAAAVKFTADFSRAYPDSAAVEEALYAALSREDHTAFLAMSGDVQAALAKLETHQRKDSH